MIQDSRLSSVTVTGFPHFKSPLFIHFHCTVLQKTFTSLKKLIPLVLLFGAPLVVQIVKNLPAMQDTQVLSLGLEDPLEEEMATYSSILAWRIPWTEETGGLHTVHGVTQSQTQLSY